MPDVALIPAIASFFGVSTDELFDFNLYEVEKNIEAIVSEHVKYWDNPQKCEELLREGLKKYPGNDILLNCLIGIIPLPERAEEVIELCKDLIAGTRCDEVRIDSYRIMALAYHSIGEYALCKNAIEHIPEIYFTKLSVAASLLEGDDKFEAACKQQSLSFDWLISTCRTISKHYEEKGEVEKALMQMKMAKDVLLSAKNDFEKPPYTKNLFDSYGSRLKEIEEDIGKLTNM